MSTVSRLGEGVGAAAADAGPRASNEIARAYINRFTRDILAFAHESAPNSAPIPMEVAREPLPQSKTALARGTVAPCCRHLRDAQPQAVGFDRELEPQLEAALRFDGDLVQQALRVEAEVAGRVVDGQAAQPVQ